MSRSEESKKHKQKLDNQYVKEHYHRISLNVRHQKYEELKQASSQAGETVTGYIKKAIDDRLSSSNQCFFLCFNLAFSYLFILAYNYTIVAKSL